MLQRIGGAARQSPTTTKRSNRTVPLLPFLVQVLIGAPLAVAPSGGAGWRAVLAGHALPVHLDRRHTARLERPCPDLERVVRPARSAPRVRLHGLRHTYVSLLLALGVSRSVVMEVPGHPAIEMTMNVYAHVPLKDQRAALTCLDDQLTNGFTSPALLSPVAVL